MAHCHSRHTSPLQSTCLCSSSVQSTLTHSSNSSPPHQISSTSHCSTHSPTHLSACCARASRSHTLRSSTGSSCRSSRASWAWPGSLSTLNAKPQHDSPHPPPQPKKVLHHGPLP